MTYTVLRILTWALGIVGSSLILPLVVAVWQGEKDMIPVFAIPMFVAWIVTVIFFIKGKEKPKIIGIQDAFVVVGAIWIAMCLYGAVPLYFSGCFKSVTDAVFESVSGFTTTGATVLSNIDALPKSVNVWRCQSHWLGGLGVVALAVAVLPLLGAGGFRLIKAETTGPEKAKFTGSITTTAKILWFVYLGFTALQTLLLWYSGLNPIDALCHAFSTLGTGGFSTRTASVGAFENPMAEWICVVFMLLASVSFVLYCKMFTGRISEVWKNSELRLFLVIVFGAILLIAGIERFHGLSFAGSIRDVCFQVSAVISSTGFSTNDYTKWVPASQMVIFFLFFIGGCSGSTAGGVKVIRWAILGKQFFNEMRHLIHPYEVFTLRVNGKSVREIYVSMAASFVFVYLLLVMVSAFISSIMGYDIFTSISVAASMVGNIGPSFGEFGPSGHYGNIPDFLKWWYSFVMLAGRLEIYTLLILIGGVRFNRGNTSMRKGAE
ncbi:MAG: TrkH family potassium uptake protein [Kiritimatiellae bacterium]|nr:TrkH family potassium uptake protein [Kiritimatiellia bacterium]